MNYLANYLIETKPDLHTFVVDMKPVSDATNVNFTELFKDFNLQQKQVKDLKKEAENSEGIGSKEFIRRMTLFIHDAEVLLNECDNELNNSWEALKDQMVGWGLKEPKQGSDPDPASTFFTMISKFCKGYQKASDENKRKKEMAAKKARQEAEKVARAAKRAAKAAASGGGAAKEDIFDAFDKKMKGGNANDIISEFKNRHKKGGAGAGRRSANRVSGLGGKKFGMGGRGGGNPMAGMMGELAGKLKKTKKGI